MKSAIVAVVAVAGLAACSGAHPTAGEAQHSFEAAVIPGSGGVGDDLIKMDSTTGAAWIHCCGSRNTNFMAIKDASPLPPGDYRLVTWSNPGSDGSVSWNAYRFDTRTGHAWVISGSDTSGYEWQDVNVTVAFQ